MMDTLIDAVFLLVSVLACGTAVVASILLIWDA